MSSNPPKRHATISFIIAVAAAVMIFVPESVGIDGFNGGFAISFISIVIALTFGIVGFIFLGWASKVSGIQRGEGILAHWIYTPEFWAAYTEEEHQEEYSEKKGLFLIITAIALFFGVLFWVFDEEAGFFVFLVMLGLIGLCFLAWQYSVWSNYRSNRSSGSKEVFITRDAIFMNNRLTTWKTALANFEDASFDANRRIPVLIFEYSQYTGRAGRQQYCTRVPVPPGQELAARHVIEQINQQN
ncbi:hypothetical protein GX563_09485 [Candidatus Bathyarchaeota archaeon]|nr:hypothetical protein [Candidatus Bathyarchaeota archaeon]